MSISVIVCRVKKAKFFCEFVPPFAKETFHNSLFPRQIMISSLSPLFLYGLLLSRSTGATMEIRFDHKVVLITGASSGIGRAMALEFGRCGAHVAVNYLKSSEAAQHVVREIERGGQKAISIQADVSRKKDVESLIQAVLQDFERIDILINNAGSLIKRARFSEITEEVWDRAMEVNLKSVFLCSQAVVPIMEREGGGRIINICSGVMHSGGGAQRAIHYASAKAGIIALTRGMAKEFAGKNILVNGINPGIVTTPLQEEFSTVELRELSKERIPLKREGRPEEIAAVAIFLASEAASYIAGEVVEVNGGLLMV